MPAQYYTAHTVRCNMAKLQTEWSVVVTIQSHISTCTSFATSIPTHVENDEAGNDNSSNLQFRIHQMPISYILRVRNSAQTDRMKFH